ncbi:MAG: ATP-dependent protease ATPase subunit HslU [candidate division WOR-3 bacterium]|uniref:ATP-dependent protease ATPase subunit HslU n=1 Tax=candidate division WOR-3 bacterium TaxID=2052148 RepID=A0A7V4ABA3_UNCW3
MKDYLTPKEIVRELDKYIVGQEKAKRVVAIALRNRWRRKRVEGKLKEEIFPSNILMIGPTGVGKTEISRRLAQLTKAPFLKVEATKFTEVGYVGRDVESMIRDLVEISINMVREERTKEVEEKAKEMADERILDVLVPSSHFPYNHLAETREKYKRMLKDGALEEREIEIEVEKKFLPFIEVVSSQGVEAMNLDIPPELEDIFPKKKQKKRMKIKDARKYFFQEEAKKLINMDEVIQEALRRAQEDGIIFIDEIDKIVSKGETFGPDVSREGVQRDLLPVVEGTTVVTKYGVVKTDHILFIAAGAFSRSRPSDLIPELQGRFPIRVELDPLTSSDFKRILVEPENSLVKQFQALFKSEGFELIFQDNALDLVAHYAYLANQKTEDIGARRLHTIMNLLLEEPLFELPDIEENPFIVTKEFVEEKLSKIVEDVELSRYIL